MPHHPASHLNALYRVFVLPALTKPTTTTTTPARLVSRRPFSQTPLIHAKTRPAEQRRQRWDSEIPYQQLYLVDPVTNTLSPPQTRYDTLKNLDTRTHRLVQLSADEPNNPTFIPVCKIVSKKEVYESEKKRKLAAKDAKKANARGSEQGMKTLELNWAIDKGDLAHRLGKLRSFLEEGRRVEVCFMPKKRGRKASVEECEDLIESVRDTAGEIEGVKEKSGGLEGKVAGFASLEFIAKGVKVGSAKVIEEDDEEDGREK